MSESRYVIVAGGPHVINLLAYNPVKVAAIFDFRVNGALQKSNASSLTDEIYPIGAEKPVPFLSVSNNKKYYARVQALIDNYPNCKFIITNHYTPLSRFIIDKVGVDRIELWEDGLNHYLKLEQIALLYKPKALVKLLAGYYAKGIFDTKYKEHELCIKDRFCYKNLAYPRPTLKSGLSYYIGQPLIEDNLVAEKKLQSVLFEKFAQRKQKVIYLSHPREIRRQWWNEIFDVLDIQVNAERYVIENGASEIHSAFSTVNLNVQCDNNVFHCKSLGMHKITQQLAGFDFDVAIR